MSSQYIANEDITFEKVIVITETGENLGIKTIEEAMELASIKELDLVMVNPNDENPVCRIMDLGKKRYEENQKEKENKAHHKKQKIKEIRFSVHTDVHDLKVKAKSINKFLSHGLKVKIAIRFPNRQKETIQPAIENILKQLTEMLDVNYEVGVGSYANNNYQTEFSPKK